MPLTIWEGPLRYEVKPKPVSMIRIMQQMRLRDYRKILDKIRVQQEEFHETINDKWYEEMERKSAVKRFREDNRIEDSIVLQAAKATIVVRKRALEKLLAREQEMYREELADISMTFYKERL